MRAYLDRAIELLILGVVLATAPGFAAGTPNKQDLAATAGSPSYLERQVRHELAMLPYYNVFDDLEFRVNGYDVELLGQVTRPVLKSDAENVVKRIEGVGRVINRIEVLPPSPFDDGIRIAEYRAVLRHGSLSRYSMGANPSIHIIVDNGHVTLVGVVASEMDRNLAFLQANSVPDVFSVTNNLRVEN